MSLAFSALFACKKEEVEEEGWGELAEKWPIFADSMSEITKNAAFLDKTQYRYEKATSDRLERLETELGILLKLKQNKKSNKAPKRRTNNVKNRRTVCRLA